MKNSSIKIGGLSIKDYLILLVIAIPIFAIALYIVSFMIEGINKLAVFLNS